MKKSLLLSLLLALCISVTGQNWVTIPDANFANKLNQLFPECMDGNLMNTECPGIINATSLNASSQGIVDFTGINYFVNLIEFSCVGNGLTVLPELPPLLEYLGCYSNLLTSLPELPPSLKTLWCDHNNLTSLPELPASLTDLQCYSNGLTSLPELPPTLVTLLCSTNGLTSLPELPPSLNDLHCNNNNLTSLPELPPTLVTLRCSINNLTSLPELPPSLNTLFCYNNNLTYLPELPLSLNLLFCFNNNLTNLPELPATLARLRCHNNQLTCLPTLPMSLINTSTNYFNISNNLFTCLPNYVPAMTAGSNSQWLSYPLCNVGDTDNNPFDCISFTGVFGTVYNDDNGNCEQDGSEGGVINAAIKLLDGNGNLIATTFTVGNEENILYNFVADTGNYTVQLVTENMPFQASCVDPGIEQSVVLTEPSPSALNVDFGVECLLGFEIGVQSVVTTGWVFPGQVHTLKIITGDMSAWYGLQCAQGVSGTVSVQVSGPVSYIGPAAGSLTPSVTGDLQFTYDIADFSLISIQQDFRLLLQTNTTAQSGELVCVNIIIDSEENDINPGNNTYNHCYEVINSYDPNIKQVWPQNVEPGFDGYFNYTIYFQNTGTAPAFNIRLADTFDTNLDLSTFQVTNYSHPVLTYLHGNVLTFRFNNIMLPDSTTDLEGSIGFVQYCIKPIADLPVGTVIENTAHIFFDFNDAIVTNTTQNEYVIPTSVAGLAKQNNLMLFPNPASGLFTIEWNNHNTQSTIEVFNMNGVRVLQKQSYQNREEMDLSTYPAGVYMVRVSNSQTVLQTKLIKR